ncbi:SDR family oxidoreductase [Parafrankia sp. FMc2]|uniref:SDR family oxidoreductase n=1 Tax=Parafrankia sp. FMc2 TaxID=3233196 RepID=UPI0034D47DE3
MSTDRTVPVDSFDFAGTVAVITGGGSGIGRAAALSFAGRGARVVVSDLVGRRAKTVAAEIRSAGGQAAGITVDVTRAEDFVALRDTALREFGRVDVVMNNAGVLALGAPESLPDEAWEKVLDVNLLSIARSNRVFLPLLLKQGSGHVVNTASASGLLAYGFDRLPYVASKHAVVGMSEALALYLGPRGIGVTCVCPSGVMTNISEQITVYGQASSSPRAPAHAIVSAEKVGELTAEAVAQRRFLVLTVPAIQAELVERAADLDAYLNARIAEQDAHAAEQAPPAFHRGAHHPEDAA